MDIIVNGPTALHHIPWRIDLGDVVWMESELPWRHGVSYPLCGVSCCDDPPVQLTRVDVPTEDGFSGMAGIETDTGVDIVPEPAP